MGHEFDHKKFTKETFDQFLTAKVGAGKCIETMIAHQLVLEKRAFTEMMKVLIARFSDTGLKEL